jgi:hypothetical protein
MFSMYCNVLLLNVEDATTKQYLLLLKQVKPI